MVRFIEGLGSFLKMKWSLFCGTCYYTVMIYTNGQWDINHASRLLTPYWQCVESSDTFSGRSSDTCAYLSGTEFKILSLKKKKKRFSAFTGKMPGKSVLEGHWLATAPVIVYLSVSDYCFFCVKWRMFSCEHPLSLSHSHSHMFQQIHAAQKNLVSPSGWTTEKSGLNNVVDGKMSVSEDDIFSPLG